MQINFVDTLRYFSILRYASMYTLNTSHYIPAIIVLSKLSFSINRPNFSFVTNIGNEIKEDK